MTGIYRIRNIKNGKIYISVKALTLAIDGRAICTI